MSSQPPPTLPLGHSLDRGRYQIVKKLGQGGYGAVYLAQDTRLAGRQVAIKELADPTSESRQLFRREAQLLASLNHSGLVHVSDFFPDGRSEYLVMDYIEGHDLLEVIIEAERTRRPLPVGQVLIWMAQVCEATAYLHSRQPAIVHRDIKPANIRLNAEGRAILVDFGIAKIDPQTKTQRMARAVSQGFSPPEQYAGSTDTRSDVYALGATLYCLLTMRLPPDGFDRMTKELTLTPPRQINSAVAPALNEIILKAMDLNALHRYQNAGELATALTPLVDAALAAQATLPPVAPAIPSPAIPSPQPGQPPSQVRCPVCGNMCRAGARFCSRCRSPLSSTDRPCLQCGAMNRATARFCSRCRSPLPPAPGTPPDARAQIRPLMAQGDAHLQTGRFELAAQAYEQAIRLGADEAGLYLGLGQCYAQLDRPREAIACLESGAQKHPRDAAIHTQLGMVYLSTDQLSQGLQTLELAYQLAPNDDDLGSLLADVEFAAGRYSKALPILERLARAHPQDAQIQARLAMCYLQANRVSEAEQLIKELQRQNPNAAESSFLMGLIQRKKGNTRQAFQEWQKAVQQDPNHALAHYFIGEIYFEQKRWADAIRAYQHAAMANPRDADPHASMCLCYLALGQSNEAAAALQRALQIDPDNPLARRIVADLDKG